MKHEDPERSKKNDKFLVRPDSLPDLFLKLRTLKQITQSELARRTGFSESYIRKVERGQIMPSLEYSVLCSKQLDINPEWTKGRWIRDTTFRFREKLIDKIKMEDR